MPISKNSNKTLILMIHGGHSTGQRYDDGIATREIVKNKYSTNKGNSIWTEHLDKFLDKNRFDVLSPIFPNGQDFVYTEEERFVMQLLTTEKYKGYKDLVLVSHSMGTIFLQNFLAKFNLKEIFNLNLKQIHFVAPTRDFGDFKIDSNWSGILNQSENIFIYHSKDDEKCDFVDGEFYHKNLPKSQFIVFTNKGHFDQTTFPELIKNIDKL